MASIEQLKAEYERKFGQPLDRFVKVIQQRGIDFPGRSDVQSWWEQHPEAVAYARAQPLAGGQVYEGGTVTTSIGGRTIPEYSGLVEAKPAAKTVDKTTTKTVYYTKVGVAKNGGIILEMSDASGKSLGTEILPPKKWEAMRKEYYSSMSPAEKEASRQESLKTTYVSAPEYIVDGKRMSISEYNKFNKAAVEQAKNPLAIIAYGGSKIISNPTGLVGSVFAGEKGVKSFLSATREEQINIQKKIILNPSPGNRASIAIQAAVEPTLLGLGAGISLVTPATPILGRGVSVISNPIVTAGISGFAVAKGATEFIGSLPKAMKDEISIERGFAIREGSVGVLQMGLGAYGLQKSYEAMYPKPVKVSITTVGEGRSFHKIGKNDVLGLKETDMLGRVGNRKFIGRAVSDYYASVKGQKIMEGFGQTGLKYHETGSAKIYSSTAQFQTRGLKVNPTTYYTQTVYSSTEGSHFNLWYATQESIKISMAGVRMNMAAENMLGSARGMEALTKITHSYTSNMPMQSITITGGAGSVGAETTFHSHIKMFEGKSFTIGSGGTSTGVKTTGAVIGDVGGALGKTMFQNALKGFVPPSPPAPSAAIGIGSGLTSTGKTFVTTSIIAGQSGTRQGDRISAASQSAGSGLKLSGREKPSLFTSTLTSGINLNAQTTGQTVASGIITGLKTGLITTSGLATETPINTPANPPGLPPVLVPSFGGSVLGKRRHAAGKRKRGSTYAPSIAGIFTRTKFRMAKVNLGIGKRGVKR